MLGSWLMTARFMLSFATSADTHVCIVDFDKDSGDQDYENALWAACRERGLNLTGPEFDHCDGV